MFPIVAVCDGCAKEEMLTYGLDLIVADRRRKGIDRKTLSDMRANAENELVDIARESLLRRMYVANGKRGYRTYVQKKRRAVRSDRRSRDGDKKQGDL